MFLHTVKSEKNNTTLTAKPRNDPRLAPLVAACRFLTPAGAARASRAAMALSKLSGDEAGVVFVQLCNVLEPRVAVYLSSANNELLEQRQQ